MFRLVLKSCRRLLRGKNKMEIPELCNISGKQKGNFNFSLCLICQEHYTNQKCVANPEEASLQNLLDKIRLRDDVDEYRKRVIELTGETGKSLKLKKAVYHRKCYQVATIKNMVQRQLSKKAKEESPDDVDSKVNIRTSRSSLAPLDKSKCFFCQEKTSETLYNLRSFNRNKLMKEAIDKAKNDVLRVRFNSFSDAHAGDVKYHCRCMVKNVDNVLYEDIRTEKDERKMLLRYGVEVELINIVSNGINEGSVYQLSDICASYITMLKEGGVEEDRSEKYLRQYVKAILVGAIDDITFEKSPQRNKSSKVFSARYSESILDGSIRNVLSAGRTNLNEIANAAKVVRYAALQIVRDFDKALDTSEHIHENDIPVELQKLIQWILGGFGTLHGFRDEAMVTISKSICNTILYNIKTNRQVHYKPTNDEVAIFRSRYENPQVVGLAITARQHSRKQGLVNMLHYKGDSINSLRCLKIETAIANQIIEETNERGYYLPSNTKLSRIVQFHLDNTNFHEDSDDGKNVTNALLLVGSQYTGNDNTNQPFKVPRSSSIKLLKNNFQDLSEVKFNVMNNYKKDPLWSDFKTYSNREPFQRTSKRFLKSWLFAKSVESALQPGKITEIVVGLNTEEEIPIEVVANDTEPILDESGSTKEPETRTSTASEHCNFAVQIGIISEEISENKKFHTPNDAIGDFLYLMNALDQLQIPSYSAYNSVLAVDSDRTNIQANILLFPLIAGPASDFNAIYTGFKLAQNVSTHACGQKTIITLDLDLYERAIKLRNSSPEMMKSYILRLGELHIVFAQCRAIGRFLENSGIDDSWLRSELIGPCTVRQVINCSHMKRALIIHEATLLALHEIYVNTLIKEHPFAFFYDNKDIVQSIAKLNKAFEENELDKVPLLHSLFIDNLTKLDEIFNAYDNHLQQNLQSQMIRTYMRMVERLLLFIHGTRSRNWMLHLSASEELLRDLTSMDRIKYRRMLPIYLAEMYSLQSSDPEIWSAFMDGDFSVQTNEVPFTGIGMDHRGEQVNKTLKIEGGIVGISRNENARTRHMLTAPVLASMAEEFQKSYSFSNIRKPKHHQLSKAYTSRQNEMKMKLVEVFTECRLNFDVVNDPNVRNFVTNQIFPEDVKAGILSVEKIGDIKYCEFVEQRLNADKDKPHITAKIKRLNLKVPSVCSKVATQTVNSELTEVRSHRDLFGRCALVAKSSRDLDMKDVIGSHELDPVPRSLMTAYGTLHIGHINKHQIMEELTKQYTKHVLTSPRKAKRNVVVLDAMVEVQKIANNKVKAAKVKTCKDFANYFIDSLREISKGFTEIRIVFDNYYDVSLKNHTREGRGNVFSTTTRFLIEDRTVVRGGLSKFLSNIHNKQQMTIYLANKCHELLTKANIPYLISANNMTSGSILSEMPEMPHNHEEADTNMIWHCIDASRDSIDDTCIVVMSPDTDVLCLLVRFFDEMCQDVCMKTAAHLIDIKGIVEMLGESKSKSLIVLHALSGCDTTGRFINIGKKAWIELFLNWDQSIDKALLSLESENPLSHIDQLEEFVCRLYCSKKHIRTLKDTRYDLYCLDTSRCERLPPTSAAFKETVLRAACTAITWGRSNLTVRVLPDPENYGWKLVEGKFIPIPYVGRIAPDSILDLVKCGCAKGICSTGRCKCHKTGMTCTDMCRCSENCTNTDCVKFELESNVDDADLFERIKT